MGTIKRTALAGLVAVATSAPAFAADLLPPPPPPPPVPVPIVDVGSGWYLRGDVGVGALDFGKFVGVNVVTPPGFQEPPGGSREPELSHPMGACRCGGSPWRRPA